MAGRGRGRGRGRGSSFAADALGLGRGGESLPPPTVQPPPLFPPLELSPAPLPKNEEDNYMYLLKQEFRGYMRDSAYYIKPVNKKKDIERYSDKYQVGSGDNGIGWQPDWKRFPKELRIASRKARPPKSASSVKPSISSRVSKASKEDVIQKLNELEKKEDGTKSGEEDEEEEEGQGEEDEEEYYDEEEQEEGTDYISNYFDPGDDYLDEDDGLDDGPTY